MIPRDPDHPHVRWELIVVRDVDEPDLGVADSEPATGVSDLKVRGVGSELSDAYDEIKAQIDLANHVGEPVAEIFVDVSDPGFAYTIEWRVTHPVRRRIHGLIRGWRSRTGGER